MEATQANNLTADNGYDLGPVPSSYAGTTGNYVRLGIGAGIAWTLAMTLLAIAVAAIPRTKSAYAAVVEPSFSTDLQTPVSDIVGLLTRDASPVTVWPGSQRRGSS